MPPRTADRAVYVIATTPEGTARALHEARQHATAMARIALIVPAVVHDGHDGHATADTAELMTEYGTIAARAGVRAPYVCVCRQPREVIAGFPTDGSTLIVIGGASGDASRPSPERELASLLLRDGHHVVFADLSGAQHSDAHADRLSSDEG